MFEKLKSFLSIVVSKATIIPLAIGTSLPLLISGGIGMLGDNSPVKQKINQICSVCTSDLEQFLDQIDGADNKLSDSFTTVCKYICNKDVEINLTPRKGEVKN